MSHAKMTDLIGKTMKSIVRNENDETLTFRTIDGEVYVMGHLQDCCESVYLNDINGELDDLIGSPIVAVDESTNSNEHPPDVPKPKCQDSFTWTFYRISTTKGSVHLRWYGESNGYYSESVNLVKEDGKYPTELR